MRKLNDPKRIAQCARIKDMIREVAADPAHKDDYYAKLYHHWKLSPTVPLSKIEAFEKRAGIELPENYVYYLTQVGGGGASPGTGFDVFQSEWKSYDGLQGVSEQLTRVMLEAEWKERYGEHKYEEPGTINLCGMDITFVAFLIVNGPMRGHVVYLDWDGDCAPMWPKGSSDFLDWNENFYSELLAGYDIYPTWKFMWQAPGNTKAMVRTFMGTKDMEAKKEIIWSFQKFKTLPKAAEPFFASIQEPELRKCAEDIREYFDKKARGGK